MRYYFTIFGAVFGAMSMGFSGVALGALLGLVADVRLQRVEDRLGKLVDRLEQPAGDKPKAAVLGTATAERTATTSEAAAGPAKAPATGFESATPAETPTGRPPAPKTHKRAAGFGGFPPAVSQFLVRLRAFASGGNTIARVGMLVLFIGLSLLVKYAADNDLFPIELRLASTAVAGIALLATGWRTRLTRRAFAMVIQGGGVAVLYLTVFAAFRLYDLVPAPAAFGLLVAITVLGAILAIRQDSQSLAVLSLLGGFFAPVIASTGAGNHVALFGYYVVLNLAVLLSAWFKTWRPLHIVGFLCTFGIATAWGGLSYDNALFGTTEPFLIVFFLIYFTVSLFHARRKAPQLKDVVDGTLVFGLPVVAFSLQSVLVAPYEFGLAWSALVLGIFYAAVASVLFKRAPEAIRLLVQSFAGLSLALGTMTLPFALDATWTGTGWALEGAALVWLGFRQRAWLVRASGYVLQWGASLALFDGLRRGVDDLIILNAATIGCLALTAGALTAAYLIFRNDDTRLRWEQYVEPALVIIGVFWWLRGGIGEIQFTLSNGFELTGAALFVTATFAAMAYAASRMGWSWFGRLSFLQLPMSFVLFVIGLVFLDSFFDAGGVVVWPASVAGFLFILSRLDKMLWKPVVEIGHAALMLYTAVVGIWLVSWFVTQIDAAGSGWRLAAMAAPAVAVLAVASWGVRRQRWPFPVYERGYLLGGAVPIIVGLALAALWAVFNAAGDADPLPFVPILNPLDIVYALGLVAAIQWHRMSSQRFPRLQSPGVRSWSLWLASGLSFLWLNGTLARSIHHWSGVGYSEAAMFSSALFQSSLSIFWAILGVAVMSVSAKRSRRRMWFVGAALIGIVVVKLFAIDLSSIRLVARIVSFIVVGVLLLLVGYLAPVPPRSTASDTAPEPAVPG